MSKKKKNMRMIAVIVILAMALPALVGLIVKIKGDGVGAGKNTDLIKEPKITKSGGIEPPFKKLSEDRFRKVVLDNEYIRDNFDLKEVMVENISQTMVEDTDKYNVKKSYEIKGKGKIIEDGKSVDIKISTNNEFDNPNELLIEFGIGDNSTEKGDIDTCVKQIIAELFDEKTASRMDADYSGSRDAYTESGDYKLKADRTDLGDSLMYRVVFDKVKDRDVAIDGYESSREFRQLYKEFDVFNGSPGIDGFASNLASLYGDYKECKLIELLNTVEKDVDSKDWDGDASSLVGVSIEFNNDITVSAFTSINDNNMDNDVGSIVVAFNTSTNYCNTVRESLDTIENIINRMFKTGIKINENKLEDVNGVKIVRLEEETSKLGKDIELEIKVEVESGDTYEDGLDGVFSTVQIIGRTK